MTPPNELDAQDVNTFRPAGGREAFWSKGMSLLNQGLFREAMSLTRERVNLFPGDVDARMMYGLVLGRVGRDRDAQVVLEAIMEDLAAWAPVFEYLGDIAQGQGDVEKAKHAYQTLFPFSNDAATKARLAKKLEALGVENDPDQDRKANDLSSEFQTMTMAELYIRQGHWDRAEQILKKMIHANPGDQEARARLQDVDALRMADRTDQAVRRPPEMVIQELTLWLTRLSKGQSA